MDLDSIKKLQYSYAQQNDYHLFPQLLIDSLELISEFFKNNSSNKLCLVFPSKELAAQWISIPLTLKLIEDEYDLHKKDITEAYKNYKPGQRLLLNNEAVVEWVSGNEKHFVFKTKGKKRKNYWESTDGDAITISATRINNLRPAPASLKTLSSRETVHKNLVPRFTVPIDSLLGINSNGNLSFQSKSICLISRFKSYEESIDQLQINGTLIDDYLLDGKIDDTGKVSEASPLVIANNFLSLVYYLAQTGSISKIIIDSYKTINDKGSTDFADIDREFNLPTILITDLSEIEAFDTIGNHGFQFFSFTKEHIIAPTANSASPFSSLDLKLRKYISFQFHSVQCRDEQLEVVIKSIQSIQDDESDSVLTKIKISLIKLANIISRIVSVLDFEDAEELSQKQRALEALFNQHSLWLGESSSTIKQTLVLLREIIAKYQAQKSEKCAILITLLKENQFNLIICITSNEVNVLSKYLKTVGNFKSLKIISLDQLGSEALINTSVNAVLTGWPKATNFNMLLSSFIFSKLTVLFYEFENQYYNSLQRRNLRNLANIKTTIDKSGLDKRTIQADAFSELYKIFERPENTQPENFDVVDFELKLDDAQYSKYYGKINSQESVKARRIDFERETFIYATEPHKFVVINDLFNSNKKDRKIHHRKFDSLHINDTVAVINTDRDILVELVELNTNPDELKSVKSLTDLWKNLLKDYYVKSGNDFKGLVAGLRKLDCIKHEATIKTWLTDENRIGPDDDLDLMSIALLTNSDFLIENISKVRKAIDQMVNWRYQASNYVRERIERKLTEFTNHSSIKTSIEIQDLGKVDILKVVDLNKLHQDIDKRFANKLLYKEV